jgi:hypothetical protein
MIRSIKWYLLPWLIARTSNFSTIHSFPNKYLSSFEENAKLQVDVCINNRKAYEKKDHIKNQPSYTQCKKVNRGQQY